MIVASLTSVFHIRATVLLNRKRKSIDDKEPYIKHLQALIKEHENTARRQNIYLKNETGKGN